MINSDEKFERVLEDLLDKLGDYPSRLTKEQRPKNCIVKNTNQTEKALYSIQATIEDMRLCIKYLLFDLDATRRENVYYKKLLGDKDA